MSLSLDEGGMLVEHNESTVVLATSAREVTLRIECDSAEQPLAAAWIDLDGDGVINDGDLITPDFIEVEPGRHHLIEMVQRDVAAQKALGPKVGSS